MVECGGLGISMPSWIASDERSNSLSLKIFDSRNVLNIIDAL